MTSDIAAPAPETRVASGHADAHSTAGFAALTLGSIGVVYGDIGTSPLYALREAVVAASAGGGATPQAVMGVVSLILWELIIVVTLKYVVILLRADNHGEGGTLALSVLSAIEGIKVDAPSLEPFIVPITMVILLLLFAVQSRGTARVAAF